MNIGLSLLTIRPGMVGGAETYVQELLKVLPAAGDVDRVAVFGNSEVVAAYQQRSRTNGFDLRPVSGMEAGKGSLRRALGLGSALLAPTRIWGNRYSDLDMIHFPVAVGLPEPKLTWAVTLHDVAHHAVADLFSRADRAYRAVAYDRAARRADLVITVSEHAKGQIVDYLGVAPEKVIAIPLGIDHERFVPNPTDADADAASLKQFELPERYIYYPANMWNHKNHIRLIEAFGRVPDKDLHLVLTGQTYGREAELHSAIAEAGASGRVRHIGYVPASAIPALYRGSLALVFPSLFEGFGIPPLEAMACGIPVAASNSGSLGEVLANCALGFSPTDVESITDAISVITSDEHQRQRLVKAGISRAQEFTWSQSAARHINAYRDLIESGR